MRKSILIVLALLLNARTIFSEIILTPDMSLSSSIESRFGFLLYETDNNSYFHSGHFNADLLVHSKKPQDQCNILVDVRYLYGNSDRSDFDGTLHFGSINTAFSKKSFQIRMGFGTFKFPETTQILSEKPCFKFNNIDGYFLTIGGMFRFNFNDKDWKVSADLLFGKADIANGDMYYFYGRPDNFVLFAGKTTVTGPYGISIISFGGNLSESITTNERISVGNDEISIFAFYLSKKIQFSLADYFSIIPFAGYVYLSSTGTVLLTTANQTYSLFPFKYVGGNYDIQMHFLSTGISFSVRKGGFNFKFDFFYLVCIENKASGRYSYKFKKNILFDGESGDDKILFPNTVGTHIFAGMIEASYSFNTLKHIVPTVKITKVIAAAILTKETTDFLNGVSSSHSTVSETSASSSDNDLPASELIKRALLSGTSVAIKIEF